MKSPDLPILAAGFAASSTAADIDIGNQLHACRDSVLHARVNRRVLTLPQLGVQVKFCKDNFGLAWFDDEVDDVVTYLNKNHYHF